MGTKDTDTVCNGCGQRKPTSREHLIHVAVSQVVLKNRRIRDGKQRDAALRDHPFLSALRLYPGDPVTNEPGRRIHLTVWIENLFCQDCNGTWARRLEDAGSDLYQFIHYTYTARRRRFE